MHNSEDDVVDVIDQLVSDELAIGPIDSYTKPYSERCQHCKGAWHGQPHNWQRCDSLRSQDRVQSGCPGAYATDEQVAAWVRAKTVPHCGH